MMPKARRVYSLLMRDYMLCVCGASTGLKTQDHTSTGLVFIRLQ